MNKSVFVIDTPKDCLSCPMRFVIHEPDKHYQQCRLDYQHGYKLESFFNDDDLKEGWISPKCPLISEESFMINSNIHKEENSVLSKINKISNINNLCEDYLITCKDIYVANELFIEFSKILSDNNEHFQQSFHPDRCITFANGTRFRFISILYKEKYTRGFRGKIINDIKFQKMIRSFNKSNNFSKTIEIHPC